jgi:hypothetical protein
LLLGEPGRLPFLGHFRFSCAKGGVRLSGAGRVAARDDAESAFAAARRIEQAFAEIDAGDRGGAIREAWSRLLGLPRSGFGSRGGNDLAVLLVAEDESGVEATARGIGALWGMTSAGVTSALEAKALLGEPGLAPEMPGPIAIDREMAIVVGAPTGLALAAPTSDDVAARCGVHA